MYISTWDDLIVLSGISPGWRWLGCRWKLPEALWCAVCMAYMHIHMRFMDCFYDSHISASWMKVLSAWSMHSSWIDLVSAGSKLLAKGLKIWGAHWCNCMKMAVHSSPVKSCIRSKKASYCQEWHRDTQEYTIDVTYTDHQIIKSTGFGAFQS